MFRTIFRLWARPEPEWLPLPYEQAILVPAPPPLDLSRFLTADGKQLRVLEPAAYGLDH